MRADRDLFGIEAMTGRVIRVARDRAWADVRWRGGWSKRQAWPDSHLVILRAPWCLPAFPAWLAAMTRFPPADDDWRCRRCDEFLAGYGFYPGGDPRVFNPDPECNTPEEITRWGLACWRAWAYGEDVATSTGWVSARVHVCGGWMGTYFWECDCWERELCVGEVAA